MKAVEFVKANYKTKPELHSAWSEPYRFTGQSKERIQAFILNMYDAETMGKEVKGEDGASDKRFFSITKELPTGMSTVYFHVVGGFNHDIVGPLPRPFISYKA